MFCFTLSNAAVVGLLLACACAPRVLAQQGFMGGGMGGGMGVGMGGMGGGMALIADQHPVKRPINSPARWVQSVASDAEAKIRAQLDAPTAMEFADVSLQDAIDYLKQYHGIEIQLDTAALQDAGIGAFTQRISRKLAGIPLRSALHLMLDSMGLIFVIHDEVLLITTPDGASNMIELRIHPVGDLGKSDDDLNELAEFLRPLLGGESELHAHRALLFARASAPIQEELSRTLSDLRGKLNSPK
jgi:hypothetical protein